jgi:hypothetical protein
LLVKHRHARTCQDMSVQTCRMAMLKGPMNSGNRFLLPKLTARVQCAFSNAMAECHV